MIRGPELSLGEAQLVAQTVKLYHHLVAAPVGEVPNLAGREVTNAVYEEGERA